MALSFFFSRKPITGLVYLDMLENFLIPQIEQDDHQQLIHSNKTGYPYLTDVQEFLDTAFPKSLNSPRWADCMATSFPRFDTGRFFWGFIKDKVFHPPLPEILAELKRHTTAAVQQVTLDMLQRVWEEADFTVGGMCVVSPMEAILSPTDYMTQNFKHFPTKDTSTKSVSLNKFI